ncbi:MAG: AbgT family transporter [Steroidobacteraceae bacterium]
MSDRPGTSPLDVIERLGNRLPEPPILFCWLALFVVLGSALGAAVGWSVQPLKPVAVGGPDGVAISLVASGAAIEPRSLLTADGLYFMFSSMLRNFAAMPALQLVFVSMLGIGLAERFGFFSALMRQLAFVTPARLLTPVIVFLGANSSVASDAGYVVLPPLAAALYLAAGRHPVAGLAAAFCGVAGGFGGGLFPTGGDGVLTGFAQEAAHVVDPSYSVTILHNFYFKVVSAFVVTAAGWWVTDRVVEPRLRRLHPGDARTGDGTVADMTPSPAERRALRWSLATMGAVMAVFAALIWAPGSPLHGPGQPTLANGRALVQQPVEVAPAGTQAPADATVLAREPLSVVADGAGRLVESPGPRWSQVIVPMILLAFLLPGIVYGRMTGVLSNQADFVAALNHGIRSIVPVLVILFFLAQFVNYFAYSQMDRMLAYAGGSLLFEAALPIPLLIVLFVLVVVFGDFAMSGMLSKFGVLAPIFVPMFMIVGMSPELTTAAYRIGDSVVNIVTPLNSYMLIVLAVLQRYRPAAGLGTLISLMVPYSLALGIAWTAMLVLWFFTGLPLGPTAPLGYAPGG